MNKEIEEMAVIGCVRNPQAHTAEECAKCDFRQGMCNAYRHAEALYNAGYRKIENANGHNLPHEIDYLLTEFDEMGFAPTSLCDNPEGKAKLWKSALVYEIGLLLNEYAAIKGKAVKEFAGKIKAKLNAIFGKTICSDLDTEDITDIIDELLKEYENGKNKD